MLNAVRYLRRRLPGGRDDPDRDRCRCPSRRCNTKGRRNNRDRPAPPAGHWGRRPVPCPVHTLWQRPHSCSPPLPAAQRQRRQQAPPPKPLPKLDTAEPTSRPLPSLDRWPVAVDLPRQRARTVCADCNSASETLSAIAHFHRFAIWISEALNAGSKLTGVLNTGYLP
jgi:hypothetical protein